MADVESMSVIKDFGRFQKRQFLLFCLAIFVHPWFSIGNTFYSASVEHYCRVTDNQTFSDSSHMKKCTIPYRYVNGDLKWDSCRMYANNLTNQNESIHFDTYSQTCRPSNVTRLCDRGWIYDRRDLHSTVVTEFDLVCGKDFMKQLSKSVSASGELIGSLIFGQVADVYGRKPTVLVAGILCLIFGICTAFAPSFVTFIIGTFLSAFSASAICLVIFVLATEATPTSRRPLISSGCSLSYSVGYLFLGITAYIVHGNWRLLQFISGAVCLLFIPYFWILEESIRWHLQAGENRKARIIINRASNMNGDTMNEELFDVGSMCSVVEQQSERKSMFTLFKTPVIRKRILITSFCWFAIGLMYFGISLNVNFFAKNPYVIFVFTAAVEIPAALLNCWLLQRYQRRIIQCMTLISSAVVLMIGGISGTDWLLFISVILVKLFVTLGLNTATLYTAELFPTPVRNAASGLTHVFMFLGDIIAPFIMLLDSVWYLAPLTVFSVPCIISGLLILLLPDTMNGPAPDSIEELENPYIILESNKNEQDRTQLVVKNYE
ncbi:organic cation transporter protein-like [Saccoglossus kowalevskii]|uniref:Organic cation transporter protein-like n=1 Tax=Saccoglossus kowalevskii TaxID=10224 RepID=A0ABM0MZW0_SACKO|nr:PREDICTED: organic cation transporter protein-like [Saccoglossus kowalevskii]